MCSSNDIWKLGRLNHVAIATPNLTEASKFYKDVLRAKVCENRLKISDQNEFLINKVLGSIHDSILFLFSVSQPS